MRVRESLFLWLANHLPRLGFFDRGRYAVLKLAGMQIDGRPLIWGPVTVRPLGGASRVAIGDGSFLNTNVRFGLGVEGRVTLGRNVSVGPGTSFETVGHGLAYVPGEGRGNTTKPIAVADEVWIGAGAIVLQGVTIGRGSVITAGAVVTEDVPARTVAGGVPARVLRELE